MSRQMHKYVMSTLRLLTELLYALDSHYFVFQLIHNLSIPSFLCMCWHNNIINRILRRFHCIFMTSIIGYPVAKYFQLNATKGVTHCIVV